METQIYRCLHLLITMTIYNLCTWLIVMPFSLENKNNGEVYARLLYFQFIESSVSELELIVPGF